MRRARLNGVRLVVVVLLAGAAALTACTDSEPEDQELSLLRERVAELEQELDEAEQFRQSVDDLAADLYRTDEPVVFVFIEDDVASDEVRLTELTNELAQMNGVIEYAYVSKADAYKEAQVLFANNASMMETIEQNPTLVPASLRFTMETFIQGLQLQRVAQSTDGVEETRLGRPVPGTAPP